MIQVLQGENGRTRSRLNAFDQQKEAVMASLFKLMLMNTGPNKPQQRDMGAASAVEHLLGSSREETLAARDVSFIPLCATDAALQLSARNQPASPKRASGQRIHLSLAAVLQSLSKALEYLPRRVAKTLMKTLSPELQTEFMARTPGLDRLFLSMKLLAEGAQWRPGSTPAIRMLHLSPIDLEFYHWLQSTSV